MRKFVTLGWRIAVTLFAALTLLSIYLARVTPVSFDRIFLTVLAGLCMLCVLGVWVRRPYLAVTASVSFAVLLSLDLYQIFYGGRDSTPDHDVVLVQAINTLRSQKPGRFTYQFPPSSQLLTGGGISIDDDRRVFALAGVSRVTTIMCREGPRNLSIYDSDQFGFNNPDSVFTNRPSDILFVGDSFVYGNCIDPAYAFVNKIRESFPRTVNLAYGGNGPLMELGALREYLKFFSPKVVMWVYDENNDLYTYNDRIDSDLEKELRNPILPQYLADPSFSQHLIERQSLIDDVLRPRQEAWMRNYVMQSSTVRRVLATLSAPAVRALLRERGQSGPAVAELISGETPERRIDRLTEKYSDLLPTFAEILEQAKSLTEAQGAKLVFVNLPAIATVCRGYRYPLKDEVIGTAVALGLPVVDLEPPLREFAVQYSPGVVFAEWHCGGHFSEAGYEVIHRVLRDYLREMSSAWGLTEVRQ